MLSWGWGYVLPIALLVCLGAVYETSTNEETNGPSEAWWIKQSRASIKGMSALWTTFGMRMPIRLALTER